MANAKLRSLSYRVILVPPKAAWRAPVGRFKNWNTPEPACAFDVIAINRMVNICNSFFVILTIKTREVDVYCVLYDYYLVHWEIERFGRDFGYDLEFETES